MQKRHTCVAGLCVGALLFVSACDGDTPSGPDENVPAANSITLPRSMTIDSLVPSAGSTVSIGRCGFFTPATCTTSLKGTFNVTYDAAIQQPVFRVSFLDRGGRQCLYDLLNGSPLVANQPKTFVSTRLFIVTVNPFNGAYICGNTISTASIRLQLFDRNENGTPLMESVVDAAYTWSP